MEIRLWYQTGHQFPVTFTLPPSPMPFHSACPATTSAGFFIATEILIGEKTISTKKKDYLQRN
jgi:hypothetical protein